MPRLYDSEAILASIDKLLDEAQALLDMAKEEERDLTPEESARIDAITAEVGSEKDGSGLKGDLAKSKKLDALMADRQRSVQPSNNIPPPKIVDDIGSAPEIRIPATARRFGRLTAFTPRDGETRYEAEKEAYAMGKWLMAYAFGPAIPPLRNWGEQCRDWCEAHGIQAAMSTGDASLGGNLVPDAFSARIIDHRERYGVARQYADVRPMSGDHENVPKRRANLTAYAVSDNDTITASDMEHENVELTAKKWAVLSRYSSELSEDAMVSIADMLAANAGWALAKKEDDSVFIGDGTSTYHGTTGITVRANDGSHAAALHTATTGDTTFGALIATDLQAMVGKIPSNFDSMDLAWYIHKVGYFNSLARLKFAQGGSTGTEMAGGLEREFLGYPVRFAQSLNSTLTAQTATVLFVFGSLADAVTIGDRRGVSVAVDASRYFDQDQLALRVTTRTAINVHTVTGDTKASDAGPVICLKTPAS